MLAAKDDATQKALQDLIRLRVLDRRYVTLVHGYVAPDEGTITTGIARSRRDRLRMTVSDDPGAREAITTFRTLERFEAGRFDEGYSLLECHLYTGRTHQIRVHMRHIGHACVGDQLYGRGDDRTNMGAFVIAAHNEEAVIGNLVRSIKAQNYPAELIDCFVVADACTDRTAEVRA